jgi:DNA-binding transcriptional ArsR family regulator
MKRDMDLIRKILQLVESCDSAYGLQEMPEIDGYDSTTISYQLRILRDANLIEAEPIDECGRGHSDYCGINLTWAGQDFLSASSDDSIWQKAKDTVLKPTASFTFSVLLEWLKTEAKMKLGLP